MALKYKRILLKLSGEALMGEQGFGIEAGMLKHYATQIKEVIALGAEVAVVIGGGNIFRGLSAGTSGIERVQGDYMGMMATVINGMAVQSALETEGVYTRLISAIEMRQIAEPYIRRRAIRHLEKKRVVIFSAGTGNPYFTSDTGAALRASEMNCDLIAKGTKVNGIYTSDPMKDADAKKYEKLTYMDILTKDLKVMDATAVSLARENKIPVMVFSIREHGNFAKVMRGEGEFTIVSDEK